MPLSYNTTSIRKKSIGKLSFRQPSVRQVAQIVSISQCWPYLFFVVPWDNYGGICLLGNDAVWPYHEVSNLINLT